jgi:hypothetical protein
MFAHESVQRLDLREIEQRIHQPKKPQAVAVRHLKLAHDGGRRFLFVACEQLLE